MKVQIEESWRRQLQEEFDKPYFEHLVGFVKEEYARYTVFPPGSRIFHAYNTCPFEKVKVVILGQDPYHEPGQYYGLCFSVMDGVPFPPSLVNIFKEIQNDLGKPIPRSGRLERWADQGVLLINAILTVRAHQAGSHQGKGWEIVTDAAIKALSDRGKVVFILWGRFAQNKIPLIDEEKNVIIKSAHPSPFSADRGFFGSRPFSRCNDALTKFGESPIDWQLPQEVSQSDMA